MFKLGVHIYMCSSNTYIPQEVELLPEGYKYCPEIRSGMGYIPLAVPLILELPELQISHIPRRIWIFSRILKLNLSNMDVFQEVAKWH